MVFGFINFSDLILQNAHLNGSGGFEPEGSDELLDALIDSDELLFPSLSALSENSHEGFSNGQTNGGEVEQRVHHQSHARARHRVNKEGSDTQARRAKEREPPPPPH